MIINRSRMAPYLFCGIIGAISGWLISTIPKKAEEANTETLMSRKSGRESLNAFMFNLQKSPVFPTRPSIVKMEIAKLPIGFEMLQSIDFEALNLEYKEVRSDEINLFHEFLINPDSYDSSLSLINTPEYVLKLSTLKYKSKMSYYITVSSDQVLLCFYLDDSCLNEYSASIQESFSNCIKKMISDYLPKK